MTDQYGRKIEYMRISVTDRCNLRCRYCMPNGIEQLPMKDILTFEEIVEVVKACVDMGIVNFKITGGEPLVRHGVPDLIRSIYDVPGVNDVTLTTNGLLLTEQLDDLVKAGLRSVNISLDALDRELYKSITGYDSVDKVMESIHRSVDAGLKVKINAVPQIGNPEVWKDLVKLAKEMPVDVRFIEMMPIGYGKQFKSIDNQEMLQRIKTSYPEITGDDSIRGHGPAVYYHIPGFKGDIGFISAIHGKFCMDCNRIRMTSTGLIKPCLCFSASVDVKKILRETQDQTAITEEAMAMEHQTSSATPDETPSATPQALSATLHERLKEAIGEAVRMKPEGHSFLTPSEITEEKPMVAIGG